MRRRDPSLGPEVVRLLLPHRPPMLFVDRILAFEPEPPRITACRAISLSDPLLAGHYPDLALWPGMATIEGIAQTGALLFGLLGGSEAVGTDALLASLRRYEARQRLEGEAVEGDLARGLAERRSTGVLAAVNVKLLAPVYPGTLLTYEVSVAQRMGALVQLSGAASADGRVVAEGILTVTVRGQ